ncbi:hypothetical protein BDN72DRAFT_958198 [Pluteus cervinus]|uniref:Uncharacterized protein n=1 Tax=Pluteus cervinus TaxID=181527 RepID=A0ACD3AZM5_9AGAR|nr:hypothetical protein BDN72DRAFT_958198 [Pluteus cervinus]
MEDNSEPRQYPLEARTGPLPKIPTTPFWRTRKGVIGITILALAIIGAIVGVVVSLEVKKSNNAKESDSGAGAASNNGTSNVAALGGAGVAAVNLPSNGIRLYFQKDDGFIYEALWYQTTNWHSTYAKLFQPKPGSPLTAITFPPTQIHIYYLDNSNALQEYIYNHGWSNGATLPATDLSPSTSLAATTWTTASSQEIRVYYQKQDNTIQELVYSTSSGWSSGNSFTDQAYPGTGIGAFATNFNNDTLATRVFWQANDLTLNEYVYPGWTRDTLQWSATPSGSISAAAWLDTSGNTRVRLYFENSAGYVEEVSNNGPSWAVNPNVPANVLAGFKAPISATMWLDGGAAQIRTYVKSNSSNTHVEIAYSGNWTSMDLDF